MKIIHVIHKKMTDQEIYEGLKKNDGLKKNKEDSLLSAEEWKKRRLAKLKREGLNWTQKKGEQK